MQICFCWCSPKRMFASKYRLRRSIICSKACSWCFDANIRLGLHQWKNNHALSRPMVRRDIMWFESPVKTIELPWILGSMNAFFLMKKINDCISCYSSTFCHSCRFVCQKFSVYYNGVLLHFTCQMCNHTMLNVVFLGLLIINECSIFVAAMHSPQCWPRHV